jgi:hypothetical protein
MYPKRSYILFFMFYKINSTSCNCNSVKIILSDVDLDYVYCLPAKKKCYLPYWFIDLHQIIALHIWWFIIFEIFSMLTRNMCITHAQLLVVEKQPTRILQDINAYIPIVLFDMLFGNAHAKKLCLRVCLTRLFSQYPLPRRRNMQEQAWCKHSGGTESGNKIPVFHMSNSCSRHRDHRKFILRRTAAQS